MRSLTFYLTRLRLAADHVYHVILTGGVVLCGYYCKNIVYNTQNEQLPIPIPGDIDLTLQSDEECATPCWSVRSLLVLRDPEYDLRSHVRYLTSASRFVVIRRWCRNSTSLKVRKGGTESSTRSASDVNLTNGRPPRFEVIERAEGLGVVGSVKLRPELERIVLVDRRGGFVAVWRARRALGGKVCANSLTRSIALSNRLSL